MILFTKKIKICYMYSQIIIFQVLFLKWKNNLKNPLKILIANNNHKILVVIPTFSIKGTVSHNIKIAPTMAHYQSKPPLTIISITTKIIII